MLQRTTTKLEREGALEIGGLEMRDRQLTHELDLPTIAEAGLYKSSKKLAQ